MRLIVFVLLLFGQCAHAERVFYADVGAWRIYADVMSGFDGTEVVLDPVCIATIGDNPLVLLSVFPRQMAASLQINTLSPIGFSFSNGSEWVGDFEVGSAQNVMWFRDGLGYDVLADFERSHSVMLYFQSHTSVIEWPQSAQVISTLMQCADTDLTNFDPSAI